MYKRMGKCMPTITVKELKAMKPDETYVLLGLSGAQVQTVRTMANYANRFFGDGMSYHVNHSSELRKTAIRKELRTE